MTDDTQPTPDAPIHDRWEVEDVGLELWNLRLDGEWIGEICEGAEVEAFCALIDAARRAEVYDRIAEILSGESCADYTARTHRRIAALFPEAD